MAGRSATGGYDPSGIDLDEWEILESQLEESIPNYDRVNRLMTFGQDAVWRKNVRNHAESGMKVLEVGCGPGSFAEDIENVDLTCLDPSEEMLKVVNLEAKGPQIMSSQLRNQYLYLTIHLIEYFVSSHSAIFKTKERVWRKYCEYSNPAGS
jgi:SAM-dependent methyltransferase